MTLQRQSIEGSDNHSRSESGDVASIDDNVRNKSAPTKTTRQQKVKEHFANFWKWYLLGLVIFLAILLPLLFTVIIGAVVQLIINEAELPLDYASIIPQNPEEVLLSINTSFKSPLPARLGETVLYLYNQDTEPFTPYLPMPLPSTDVNGYTKIAIINKTVPILDYSELVKWFRQYLESKVMDLNVKTNATAIYLGNLQYSPNFDKTIEIDGLQSLKGVGLTDLKLVLPDEGGKNLWANAILPNWGPITLGLGNLTLDVLSGPLKVGTVTAYDVFLEPGNNTVACDGFLNLSSIVTNLGDFLQAQSGPLGDGDIKLGLQGTQATLNGERLIYVEEILKGNVFNVSVPLFNVATSLLDGLLGTVAPGIEGGNVSTSSLLDAVGSTLGNKTLMDQIKGYWDL